MNRKLIRIGLAAAVISAVVWAGLYTSHLRPLGGELDTRSYSGDTVFETLAEFETGIRPILQTKCAACHTDTSERPFFYYLPVAKRITQPYVDSEIAAARGQFDFTLELSSMRRGAVMEAVLRLRESTINNDMPPAQYLWFRPQHHLNATEKSLIGAWTERAASSLFAELVHTENDPGVPSQVVSTASLVEEIVSACPLAGRNDRNARDRCAERLARSAQLRAHMIDPFFWGGQKQINDFKPHHNHVTRFNPLVWRKYYLSLFMFSGEYTTVDDGEYHAVLMNARFRGQMADGEYPYPFWHSRAKWKNYNEAAQIILLLRDGRLVGAFRSAETQDSPPAYDNRKWSGDWWWSAQRHNGRPPRVTRFNALFSAGNPFVKPLDAAYTALFLGFREENCMTCHSPDNESNMRTLEILSSPAHALAARRRLVTVFEENAMPPVSAIEDHASRDSMTRRAFAFSEWGDRALAWEGEPLRDTLVRPLGTRGN